MPLLMLTALPVCLFLTALYSYPSAPDVYDFGDPDFGYLLNSLLLAMGRSPHHVDHPGTTIQAFGAVLIHLKHAAAAFRAPVPPLPEAVLIDPYAYLRFIQAALVFLLSAVTFWAGLATYRAFGSVVAALALQLCPWIFFDAWYFLNRFSAEVPLEIASIALAGFLARFGDEGPPQSPRQAAGLGMILGTGIATKFVFLPMLLLSLMLSSLAEIALCLFATALTFLLITSPIWPMYDRMFSWLQLLLMHQQNYGGGEAGMVPSASLLRANLAELRSSAFGFCALAAALPFFWVAARFLAARPLPSRRQVLSAGPACLLAVLTQFLIVWKHPGSRYLLPSLAAIGALLSWILSRRGPSPGRASALRAVQALLAFFVLWLANAARVSSSPLREPGIDEIKRDFYLEVARYDRCGKILASPAPYREWALSSGEMSTGFAFTPVLESLYPGTVLFDENLSYFHSFGESLPFERVRERFRGAPCLVLLTSNPNISSRIPAAGASEPYRVRLLRQIPASELKIYVLE